MTRELLPQRRNAAAAPSGNEIYNDGSGQRRPVLRG
jgi:hypothetical protein